MIQRGVEVGALLQVFLGVALGVGFLLAISTLAPAGNTTVAEMAEAAMTEKRLKFMAVTLVFVCLVCPVGL
ncbi:hypothetical protein LJU32_20060 [Pseudomonas sp. B21_DOA]|nr:hypothetical protein LJU32_20060 [Pseudomonas sp. B21_DOA]